MRRVDQLLARERRYRLYIRPDTVFSLTEEDSGGADEGPPPEPDIHWLARLGDVEGVRQQLASGVSIELENSPEWGSRPLDFALGAAPGAGREATIHHLSRLGAVRAEPAAEPA